MTDDWIMADWPAPDNVVAGTTLRGGRLDAVGLPGEPCWLKQVHGVEVFEVGHGDGVPEADASVGRMPGAVCAVRTADCLPVLFCSSDGRTIAAAHAGWRGMAAGVLEATVEQTAHDPLDLMAWFGPAISQPAFEVGDEVKDAFCQKDTGSAVCFQPNQRGRWQADLYGLARRRLSSSGITRIYGGGFCTYTDTGRFFSYRRDPDCGRMVSFVARRS